MLPNLLATRRGRLGAFFALYVTEGIPLGFAVTAIATYLRRLDVSPTEIGAFVASFYLPWSFKWAFGPVVDVFRSARFGHYRAWIIAMQLLMAASLSGLVLLDLPQQLALFTALLFVHNTFGAVQDVAIDALACNTLAENERGLANGLMFAGASLGQAIGGSGVLMLTPYTGFQPTFFFVGLAILSVTGLVVLPMKEAVAEAAASAAAGAARVRRGAGEVMAEMRQFSVQAFRAFLGSRGAFAGVLFCLLPAGAMSLGLALQSNLSVELGFNDAQVAAITLWSTIASGLAMVLGGWLSDRLGRRRTLAVYTALMSLPCLYLAWMLSAQGHVMPKPAGARTLEPVLVQAMWIATMAYNVFMGLQYGTRTAAMMDVTNPRVAGTQFTAYMALSNVAIATSASWQGIAIDAWGYPITLLIDAAVGLLGLALLPLLKPTPAGAVQHADAPAQRARSLALGLALACLAWMAFRAQPAWGGKARPILETLFTLGFVAALLVLLAGRVLMQGAPALRWAPWVALGLLVLALRNPLAKLLGPLPWPALAPQLGQALLIVLAVAAAVQLQRLSRLAWGGMEEPAQAQAQA
jgi:PAT family beta-lactamase induction signal transducer AmpG